MREEKGQSDGEQFGTIWYTKTDNEDGAIFTM